MVKHEDKRTGLHILLLLANAAPFSFARYEQQYSTRTLSGDGCTLLCCITIINKKPIPMIMIHLLAFAALLVISCEHSSAFDKRYETAMKYIQLDDTINAKVRKLLPSEYVQNDVPSFIVDDTVHALFLPIETILLLKYGDGKPRTAAYDSLRNAERPKWTQYKKLCEQQLVIPELRKLSLSENANTVIFFSRFYDNVLVAHVVPMAIEFMMPMGREGGSLLSKEQGVKAVPFVGRQYSRMTRFNQFIEVIFTFEEDGSIKKVRQKIWKVD